MVKERNYSSTIKARPLLYIETRKLAELIFNGLNEREVQHKVIVENLFQVNTESRRRELASVISTRLKILDHFLLKKLLTADLETSKFLVLYTILKTDRLFYEFVNEVYYEKVRILEPQLTDRDFQLFFETKKQQSDTVAKWKEYTIYKLTQVFIRILFDAGLVENQKNPRSIIKPLIDFDVKNHLNEIGDQHYVAILVGE